MPQAPSPVGISLVLPTELQTDPRCPHIPQGRRHIPGFPTSLQACSWVGKSKNGPVELKKSPSGDKAGLEAAAGSHQTSPEFPAVTNRAVESPQSHSRRVSLSLLPSAAKPWDAQGMLHVPGLWLLFCCSAPSVGSCWIQPFSDSGMG